MVGTIGINLQSICYKYGALRTSIGLLIFMSCIIIIIIYTVISKSRDDLLVQTIIGIYTYIMGIHIMGCTKNDKNLVVSINLIKKCILRYGSPQSVV